MGRRRCDFIDRGNSSPNSPTRVKNTMPVACSAGERPSDRSGPDGHGRGCGGSLTITRPPCRVSGAAHSIVIDGGPNPRATTTSNCRRARTSCPISSARPHQTVTRSTRPSSLAAHTKNEHRFCDASINTADASDLDTSNGRAGTPPPLPKSASRRSSGRIDDPKRAECSMWSSIGPGPRKPNWRERSSTALSVARCSVVLMIRRHSPPTRGLRSIRPRPDHSR